MTPDTLKGNALNRRDVKTDASSGPPFRGARPDTAGL